MNNIAQRIREIRIEKGLTQAELAEGIITRSYLSQIERGIFEPSYDVLEKLAKKLECDVEKILNQQPQNKNLIALQIRRQIKLAEKNIQESNIDKAKRIIENTTFNLLGEDVENEEKGILFWITGVISQKKRDFLKAINYYRKSIEVLENINQEKTVRSLSDLGYLYSLMDKNQEALEVLNRANKLAIYEQIGGQTRISLLLNLGIVHGKLNELYSAINFLIEALELNKSLKIFYKSGEINMALGICYMQLNRNELAKECYSKAIDFFELSNDIEKKAGTLNNLGILLRQMGNVDESLDKFKESIELFKEKGNLNERFNVELELAETYLKVTEYEKIYKICNNIIDLGINKQFTAKAYELLGDVEKQKNNYSMAINYYNDSERYFNGFNSDIIKKLNYKKSQIYHILGEYNKSSSILLGNFNA